MSSKKEKELYKLTEQKEKETLQKIQENYEEVLKEIKSQIAIYSNEGKLSRTELYRYKRYENLVRNIENELKNIDQLKQKELYNYVYDQYSMNYYYNGFIFETEYGKPLNYQILPKETIKASIENDLAKLSLAENSFTVRSNVQKALTQSITLGLNINDAGDLIKKALETNANNVYRIYRTETTRASNEGKLNSIKHANTYGLNLKKQWLATLDMRTRDSHGAVDGELKAEDDKFSNGLMYPGDPTGGASEVINCRCTMLQVLPGYENSRQYRVERGIDGKTKEIPYTTYSEWKKGRLENKELLIVNNKKTNNKKIKNIEETKNIKELTNFIKEKWKLEEVDLAGLDYKAVKESFKSADKLINEFPELLNSLKVIKTEEMEEGTFASASLTGYVRLNKNVYKDMKKLKESYKSDIKKGFHPKGTEYSEILTHELGHILNNEIINRKHKYNVDNLAEDAINRKTAQKIVNTAIKNTKITKEMVVNGFQNKYSADSLKNVTEQKLIETYNRYSLDDKTKILRYSISRYAMENYAETFAEAVADYTANKENSNILSIEIVKQARKELGK